MLGCDYCGNIIDPYTEVYSELNLGSDQLGKMRSFYFCSACKSKYKQKGLINYGLSLYLFNQELDLDDLLISEEV